MNTKGELNPPMYKQHAIVDDDDLPNISSVIDMELEARDDKAIIASFHAQDVGFEEEELRTGFRMSEIAAAATIPFNAEWNPAYEPIPTGQDQVGTIISSVSNTL